MIWNNPTLFFHCQRNLYNPGRDINSVILTYQWPDTCSGLNCSFRCWSPKPLWTTAGIWSDEVKMSWMGDNPLTQQEQLAFKKTKILPRRCKHRERLEWKLRWGLHRMFSKIRRTPPTWVLAAWLHICTSFTAMFIAAVLVEKRESEFASRVLDNNCDWGKHLKSLQKTHHLAAILIKPTYHCQNKLCQKHSLDKCIHLLRLLCHANQIKLLDKLRSSWPFWYPIPTNNKHPFTLQKVTHYQTAFWHLIYIQPHGWSMVLPTRSGVNPPNSHSLSPDLFSSGPSVPSNLGNALKQTSIPFSPLGAFALYPAISLRWRKARHPGYGPLNATVRGAMCHS